jgi:tetratricopeptide (TPR) repeat protein
MESVISNQGVFQRPVRLLADPATRADELVQPGHIFPLCARPGGVLERAGHTEAAVDLAALAGLRPAGVICEILSEDGTMARLLQEAGRYREAFTAYERAAAILPDRPTLSASRAVCLLKLNRCDEAVEWARKAAAATIPELRLVADADTILVLRQTGHEAEAAEHAERSLSQLRPESYQRGAVLAALGRWGEARPLLERTPLAMQYIFFWSPLWDPWRDDPRFVRLLNKLGCEKEYRVARKTGALMQQDDPIGK